MAWAEKAMQEPAFRKAPVKICILHAPMVDPGIPDDFVPHTWMNHNFLPLLNKAGVDLMIGADLHEYFYHPAGTINNAFPILVNDSESRLDVRVERGHIYVTIYDEAGNVVIFADGSKGYEDAEPVILQGHIDMVCEKDSAVFV